MQLDQAHKVLRECKAQQVFKVHLVCKVLLVQERKEHKEQLVFKVQQAHKDLTERRELLARKALLELRAQLVHKDQLELKVLQERKALLELKVRLVLKV